MSHKIVSHDMNHQGENSFKSKLRVDHRSATINADNQDKIVNSLNDIRNRLLDILQVYPHG